jgi:hypothetical protein
MDKLPKFMCIGAQRAGSTWLYQNLKMHKEIWLPPVKELHYFDELRVKPFLCERYKHHLRRRIGANKTAWRNGGWSLADFLWDLKFFGLPRSDRWYSSLFAHGRMRAAGEVTPAYSVLPASVVAEIKRINPQLKIIFLMRDPIDRAWSQACKDLPRVFKTSMSQIPRERIIAWFNQEWCASRSDYIRSLSTWLAHFPRNQFFFGFFEEIVTQPEDLLLRLFAFLGVEKSRIYVASTARQTINAAEKADIAPEYEYELARIYEPKLAVLKEMFEPYPEHWYQRCVTILNRRN